MAKVFFVPVLFLIATYWLYLLTTFAPRSNGTQSLSLGFPGSMSELKDLATLMKGYHRNHKTYVHLLFVSAYIYKQAFAIPGSVFMNVLAGALFGIAGGFPLVCVLTAIGASTCFILSKTFGKELIVTYFPLRVHSFQIKVEENKHRLFYFLLFARLFPMTPNWFINITAPVLNIPMYQFFPSVLLGLMPYNFICVQSGAVLSEIDSLDDMFSYSILCKLLLMAFAALVPGLIVRRRRTANKDK